MRHACLILTSPNVKDETIFFKNITLKNLAMKKLLLLLLALIAIVPFSASAQKSIKLIPGFKNETFLAKNQKDTYSIKLNKGDFLDMVLLQKGVDVIIDVYDPKKLKLKSFDSPNGDSGPELVQIEARTSGLYQLEVHPYDDHEGLTDSVFNAMIENNQGRYAITSVKILSAKELKQKLAKIKENDDKIIQWINTNAIPIEGVNAESGFDDLQPLKQILKDVKYVGLGEATHGTREFSQMKHRMLEFLVKEMGFTVFAIEASYSGCKNINDYVLYGKGDAHTALASQGFWNCDTEEVIDMIEWMRKYNQSVTEEKKVKFTGIDIQHNIKGGGIDRVKAYIQKVDSIRFLEMKTRLDSIESYLNLTRYLSDSSESSTNVMKRDSVISAYKNFLSFFTMSKGIYVQKSSEEEYETALDYCRILVQYIDHYLMSTKDSRKQEREWRDYYMASNFFNMVAHEKPGTKFVIWAHNVHVSHNAEGYVNWGSKPIGSYLKEASGDKYYAFGFAFNKGSFQAIEVDSLGKLKGLQEFTVKPAEKKSLDWYLAQTNQPMYIFNFRDNTLPDYMIHFLDEQHDTHTFGARAYRPYIDLIYYGVTLSADFDGIIFINETHRSRPTETGMRKEQ